MCAVEKSLTREQIQSDIVSNLHQMFGRYGATFVDLAIGARSDMDSLLEFYGAPLRYIGSTFHLVMSNDAAITGQSGIGGEIRRLRQAGFGASALDGCEVTVLNSRAAVAASDASTRSWIGIRSAASPTHTTT